MKKLSRKACLEKLEVLLAVARSLAAAAADETGGGGRLPAGSVEPGVAALLVCHECGEVLVCTGRHWSCPNLHGKLLTGPVLLANLVGVEGGYDFGRGEQWCDNDFRSRCRRFAEDNHRWTPRKLLGAITRAQRHLNRLAAKEKT